MKSKKNTSHTKQKSQTSPTGKKFDTGKADLSLIPYEVLEEIAQVLMHGARVYGRYNWQDGLSYTRLDGAGLRHRGKFMDKLERLDIDTTCETCKTPPCDKHSHRHHLAATIVNYMFLLSYELNNQNHLDDRRPPFPGKK
jgi:hypothetical protein